MWSLWSLPTGPAPGFLTSNSRATHTAASLGRAHLIPSVCRIERQGQTGSSRANFSPRGLLMMTGASCKAHYEYHLWETPLKAYKIHCVDVQAAEACSHRAYWPIYKVWTRASRACSARSSTSVLRTLVSKALSFRKTESTDIRNKSLRCMQIECLSEAVKCRDFGDPVSITRLLPLTPNGPVSFPRPSLSSSRTPPLLLLLSAESQSSPLISTMLSVAGVSELFFWHLDHPSGSELACDAGRTAGDVIGRGATHGGDRIRQIALSAARGKG